MAQGRTIGFTFLAKDLFERVSARMADSVQKVRAGLTATAEAARDTSREMERVSTSLGRTDVAAKSGSRGVNLAERAWQQLGRRVVATAAAVVSVRTFQHMLSEASTVEDAVNKVMSVIRAPGQEAAYAAKIRAVIRENQRLGLSVATLGDALTQQVTDLGTGTDSFDAFAGAVKLSVAAFQPLEESVKAVNKLTDTFPSLRGKGKDVAQLLFSGRQMTSDFPGLVAALPNIAPLSATAGISAERMIALFAVLENKTKSAAAASSIEVDLLRALGTSGTKKQQKLLTDMSILDKQGKPVGTLPTQLARLRFVAQKNPAAAAAVGLSEPTQRALLNMSDEDIRRIGAIEATLRSDAAKGTIDQSFARVQDSLGAEFAKTEQALNELASVIGKDLAPSVRTIAEVLRGGIFQGIDRTPSPSNPMVAPPVARLLGWDPVTGLPLGSKGAGGLDPGARPKGG